MKAEAFFPYINLFLIILFVSLLLLFGYFCFVFRKHWDFYSFSPNFKKYAQTTYYIVSILILGALLFFIELFI